MAADIYTKALLDREKWQLAILLISVMDVSQNDETIRQYFLILAEKAATLENGTAQQGARC